MGHLLCPVAAVGGFANEVSRAGRLVGGDGRLREAKRVICGDCCCSRCTSVLFNLCALYYATQIQADSRYWRICGVWWLRAHAGFLCAAAASKGRSTTTTTSSHLCGTQKTLAVKRRRRRAAGKQIAAGHWLLLLKPHQEPGRRMVGPLMRLRDH